MDLYWQMGEDLRELFKDLFDPKKARVIQERLDHILVKAAQIGGPLHEETKQFYAEVMNFLKTPHDPKAIHLMRAHALRLEQETREI